MPVLERVVDDEIDGPLDEGAQVGTSEERRTLGDPSQVEVARWTLADV